MTDEYTNQLTAMVGQHKKETQMKLKELKRAQKEGERVFHPEQEQRINEQLLNR